MQNQRIGMDLRADRLAINHPRILPSDHQISNKRIDGRAETSFWNDRTKLGLDWQSYSDQAFRDRPKRAIRIASLDMNKYRPGIGNQSLKSLVSKADRCRTFVQWFKRRGFWLRSARLRSRDRLGRIDRYWPLLQFHRDIHR
jgi:hypothetical protein